MSKTAHKLNHSLVAFFVLLLFVLSSPHPYAQALQKPSGHSLTVLTAKKPDLLFQNDLEKLLYLIRQDQWQEAGPFAYELAKRSPTTADAADACGLYALVLLRGGYPKEATDEARQALGFGPSNYWALVASGRIELWNDRNAQAQKFFQRAAQVRPQGAEARLGLYLSAPPGSTELIRSMFAYLALAPTGHPHDQMVAFLTSLLRGHDPLRGASPKSLKAMLPRVNFEPTAHQISDLSLPTGTQNSPVELSMTREETGLYVTALVDGHPMKLLLDTGAGNDITLTPQATRQLLLVRQGTSTISGAQGSEQSTDYLAKTLQLGPLRWSSIPIRAVDAGSGDGILGVGFLRRYVIALDLAHQVMRLTVSAEAPLAGNSRQLLRFHEYQTKIMFPARVGGQDIWAVLDTGSATTVVSKGMAEILGTSLPASAIQRAFTTEPGAVGKTRLKISYVRLEHPYDFVWGVQTRRVTSTEPDLVGASFLDEEISPRLDFEVGLNVGMPSLLAFQQMTIDYKHQSLFFDRRIEDTLASPVPMTSPTP